MFMLKQEVRMSVNREESVKSEGQQEITGKAYLASELIN